MKLRDIMARVTGRRPEADAPPAPSVEVPRGRSRVRVFTYDGTMLDGTPAGAWVRVTLLRGEWGMASVYTGTECRGNTALACGGRLVGYLAVSKNADLLVRVRDRLGPLDLWAQVDGWADGGWPELSVRFDRAWATGAAGE